MENIDSYQELKKLDEQIESATELAALKPIYFRLNEIIQAFPGDFDVQFTGNEVKQRLMARGTLLKQQGISAPPPPPASAVTPEMPPEPPAPPPPAMPETQPPPPAVEVAPPPVLPTLFREIPPETVVAPAEPLAAPQLPEPVAGPQAAEPVASAPLAPPAPEPHPSYELPVMAAPSPSFPLFPLFAGAAPQPEPPAPPAYFADTVGPAPAQHESPRGPAATLLAMSYPSHDSASAEQPPLDLGVTSEPQPVPPPPATPAVQPAPLPTPALDAVPHAPPVAPAPFPIPTPLFDFSPPPLSPPPFAMGPENPPQPPSPAMPAAHPPPLPTPFLDTVPHAPAVPPVVAAAAPPPLSSPLFDSAPPQPVPPALPATPQKPPQPPARPPGPPRPPFNWKRPVVIAPIAVLLVALVVVLLVMHQTRARNAASAARNAAAVQIDIATTPSGASVSVVPDRPAAGSGNPATCTSNCRLALAPGTYQVSASLGGFEPAVGPIVVKALKPMSVSLTLQPQAQSVRLLTDLQQGKVVVDDHPPVDLQEGQLVLDKIGSGAHTIKVAGPNGDASFSFEIGDARLPAVTGPVSARNMVAVLVTSFGKQARVVTNAGPWKLAVNGQPQSDAGPAGADLTAFQPGVNEIVVGEGKDQRNMSETFGGAPTLTAFLKTDVNAGTLIVSTGQDGVHVFLNGKEDRRLTQHGQLRVPILGKVAVRVAKSGFQEEPAQTAEVKKGAEVRLQFNLKPQPQFASLQIHGALAGTEILVDQKVAGTVGPDGLFSIGEIQPGEHTIELRREQRVPKRLQRAFQAGQVVVLAGADAVLATANGTIRLNRNPASAAVTYRRGDETEAHEIRGSQIELPSGTYTLAATAPGFLEFTTRVQLAAGESREVDFALSREKAAPPPTVANAMALFEDAQSWTKEGDSWVHKGGGFLPFKPQPKGVLTFTVELVKGGGVFRAGAIRWCLQYVDSKNYLLFEIDRKNFRAWVVKNGQRLERVPKTAHNLGSQKTFTIQIDVTADRLVQKARGGEEWKELDTFAEPGRDFTQGKFGFLIQGNDEIAITDFKFQPR